MLRLLLDVSETDLSGLGTGHRPGSGGVDAIGDNLH